MCYTMQVNSELHVCVILCKSIVYSYWLGSRTTAVLFDLRTDLLAKATGWGQQLCLRVKQSFCCPRNQSISDLLYTFIFSKLSYFLDFWKILIMIFIQQLLILILLTSTADIKITWPVEPMKIRQLVNSSIEGKRSTNCWPVNRTVMQQIGILFMNSQNVVYL